MTEEMFEILIGKYIDGQITPSEQRILETQLQTNPHATQLLEQLQDLHRRTREVIASEILEQGNPADEIFEYAWHQTKYHLSRRIKTGGYLRFAAGLAAGIVIGLTLHFVFAGHSALQSEPPITSPVVAGVDDERPTLLLLPSHPQQNVIRNVDWYSFTDEQGNEWLIEGFRENVVRPVAYKPDL